MEANAQGAGKKIPSVRTVLLYRVLEALTNAEQIDESALTDTPIGLYVRDLISGQADLKQKFGESNVSHIVIKLIELSAKLETEKARKKPTEATVQLL